MAVHKIPQDHDARVAFLEEWAKEQQSRLTESRLREQRRVTVQIRLAEEQKRLRAQERARAVARARQGVGQVVQVYAPFTHFSPGVREALMATGHPVTEVYVGDRDDAYWDLLNGLWSKAESFILVEHDIVVRADTVEELQNCPYEWCSFGAPYFGGVYHGLGCVKFSETLISRHPEAMEQVAAHPSDEKHPPKHYCRLDAYLQEALSGEYQHCHETVLEHVRPYDGPPRPGHDCIDGLS